MRHLREILRQKWELKRTNREVGQSVGVSASTVSLARCRAAAVGLDWAAVDKLSDDALEARIFCVRAVAGTHRSLPDPARIDIELRKPGVTLQLLHLEYLEQHPDGLRYTSFCKHYRTWLSTRAPPMRQVHEGGDKLFVDYSGKKARIVARETGEVREVELFVAVMGASNYTYVEATYTQRVDDWIGSHVRALEALGGVPRAIVPDQLKSGVRRSCRYEPAIQRTYAEMAQHYETVIFPARAGHPRDKAKVEVGVLIAQRWVLARLRNQTFFSLQELNERIKELVGELNARRMRVYGASRAELFDKLDRPQLKPLVAERFVCGEWKTVKVNIDYHVEYESHYYSVPHRLVHEELEVRVTSTIVEIYRRGERITSHVRGHVRGRHTTKTEHMPQSHQRHLEWSPSRIVGWAASIGPQTAQLVETIITSRPHPEQGYRSCLGILRLSKRYTPERLETACGRALTANARSYRHVELILKNGLDQLAVETSTTAATDTPLMHEHVRGREYYN